MPQLFPVTLALQAVACTLYVVGVAQPLLRSPLKVARLILLLAVFSQVADIAWLCLRGQHPGSSTREAVYFLSWLLTLAYPLLSRKHPAPLIGALLLPMAMTMEIVVRLVPGVTDPGPAAQRQLLASLHIFCAHRTTRPATRDDQTGRSRKNRAGSAKAVAQRPLDHVRPPSDLARSSRLFCPQAELRNLYAATGLPRQRSQRAAVASYCPLGAQRTAFFRSTMWSQTRVYNMLASRRHV